MTPVWVIAKWFGWPWTSPPPEMNVAPEAWSKLPLESKVTLWRMYNSGELHRR
jgi:hypothetical protein